MIRAVLLILALLPGPATAQETDRLGPIIDAMGVAYEKGGDEAAFIYLNAQLRDGRALGQITRDWAIIFAIQADLARLAMRLPLYALDLTEEGLTLVAGDPAFGAEAMALRVSRAYALADLGRFDEAISAATLALPEFTDRYGAEAAADLRATVQGWQSGQLTEGLSNSVTDLAWAAINQAEEALSAGQFARALTLAAQAALPMGGDLDEVSVRDINTMVGSLTGRALVALGQMGSAAEAYLRGLNALTVAEWDMRAPPQWFRRADWDDGFVEMAFDLAQGLTQAALGVGATDAALAALDVASDLARSPAQRRTVLLYQASLVYRSGDPAAALELIEKSRASAIASGDRATAAMAGFYVEMLRFRAAAAAARDAKAPPVPPTTFMQAIGTALAQSSEGGIDKAFVLSEAAGTLGRGGATLAALDMSRQALALRRASAARVEDGAWGAARARAQTRSLTETFLRAAHQTAAIGKDPARPTVHCPPNATGSSADFMGCTIIFGHD